MKTSKSFPELGPFQLAILVLSFFVLGSLAADLVFDLPPEIRRILRWIDNAVCVVFLIDFVVRFRRAESKWAFMKWGWIDLLASVPEISALRWGRILRLLRLLRVLRAARSIRSIFQLVFKNRTRGGLASAGLVTFLVIALSSAGILFVERSAPEANIRTAEDAVWWSITTVTTVGYGDTYPVTLGGRIIASALMITGVGLFGTLSGVVASFFLGHGPTDEKTEGPKD